MMSEEEKYQLFQQYLNGELNSNEKRQFEESLSDDVELSKELTLHRELHQLVFERKMLDLRQRMTEDIQQIPFKKSSGWKWWLLFGLMLTGLSVFVLKNYRKKDEVVFASQNQPSKSENSYLSSSQKKNEERSTSSPFSEFKNGLSESESLSIELKDTKENVNGTITNQHELLSSEEKIKESDEKINNAEKTTIDPCAEVGFNAKISNSPTCRDNASGKIFIDVLTVQGGQAPYLFAINTDRNSVSDFSSRTEFQFLRAGNYYVFVRDMNHCEQMVQEVNLQEINCDKEAQLIFNPSIDEKIQIPCKQQKSGTIKIYNQSMQIEKVITFTADEDVFWNGTNQSGIQVPVGEYVFIVQYSDDTQERGFITIQ